MNTDNTPILKSHMILSLNIPEITNDIFKNHDIIVDHNKINKKTNYILSSLKGITVAEATLIIQEVLRQTYSQLTIDNIEDIDFLEKEIDISNVPKAQVFGYV